MKTLRYRGKSDRRTFSASDVVKMGGSESSKPIDVARGGTIEVTNAVADFLARTDRKSWQIVSEDGQSDEVSAEVASVPEPVSDAPVGDPPAVDGDKTEAAPGETPTTEEAPATRGGRRSGGQ